MTEISPFRGVAWRIGRGAGGLAAAIAGLFWVFAMWTPGTQSVLSGWSFAVAFLMLLFSVIAVIAALKGHGAMMLAMFLGSFLPVGAYLIRVEHWLHWVGWLNLTLLCAALVTRWVAPKRTE